MAKSLRQQVLDLCELYGCELREYHGSHFVVVSKECGDPRTWITNSHQLIGWAESSLRAMYGDFIEDMKQGFTDGGGACDDGHGCDICLALGRAESAGGVVLLNGDPS